MSNEIDRVTRKLSAILSADVKCKLDLGFEYYGEYEAKNIKEPVRVYKVVDTESSEPPIERELKLPDKPSIAVLPLDDSIPDVHALVGGIHCSNLNSARR